MSDLLAKIRERSGQPRGEAPQDNAWADDLIPVEEEPRPKSAEDEAVDAAIRGVDIIEAYRRWCGKMEPDVGSKRESIMVSCPVPGHEDRNPSAWVNLDKNAGYCGACDIGFDPIDLFAWHRGINYRANPREFVRLREEMAAELGVHIVKVGRQKILVPVETVDDDEEGATVVRITDDDDDDDDLPSIDHFAHVPPIDWRDIVGPDSTFLLDWMNLASQDDLPEEFYFFLGLQALGAAVGNRVTLKDSFPVRPNLMLCLVGPSGMGKSRATRLLTRLVREALPHDDPGGVLVAGMPGSGESLVDLFIEEEDDGTGTMVPVPVKGLVVANELAELASKSSRTGSTIQQKMMDFYDSDEPVQARSRTAGAAEASTGHFAQFLSTTQPKVMRTLLSNDDLFSGFINRWIYALGQGKRRVSFGAKILDPTPLVDPLRRVRAWAGTGRQLGIETDALDLWDEFFHKRIVPLLKGDQSSLARIDLTLKKLMLLFAIDKHERNVSRGSVEQALALFDYLVAIYGGVEQTVQVSARVEEHNALDDEIMRAIVRHEAQTGQAAALRDVQRRLRGKWTRYGRENIVKALDRLTETGEVEIAMRQPKRGPATKTYRRVV